MSRNNVSVMVSLLILFALSGIEVKAQFTISGTVSDPGSLPVANVDVFLYDDQGDPIGGANTLTDSVGFYAINGLPVGTYGLGFEPSKSTGLLAQFVSPVVVSGNTTVNASLILGNLLSGFVRDSLGNPIFNIDLNVYDFVPDTVLTTHGDNSDISGFYQVLIPDGTFRLRWRPIGGENLIPVEIDNITIINDTAIDVTMLAGNVVSGFVTRPNMTPVFNADLDFINSVTGTLLPTPSDNTDNNGFFQVLIPNGTYDIQVEPLFADGLVPIEVLSVSISSDTSIDFTVSPGHVISGTVTDSNSTPVPNADLDLRYTVSGAKLFTPGDNTNALGQYQLLATTGMYNVIVKPPVASRLAPISIDSVNVISATVVNAVVPDGYFVSGLVRNTNLAAILNADIDAKISSSGADVFLTGDNTDASGNFGVVIVGGTYDLEIEPPFTRRLTSHLFRNLVISGDTALDVILDTGIIISGTVTDSAAVPVSNVDVSAIVTSSGDTIFTPGDNTGALGTYQILVPPDVYKLLYIPEPPTSINDTILLNSVAIVNDTTINVSFSSGLPGCCVGIRGNVNGDGSVNPNILDLNFLINYIFRSSGNPGPCLDESNVNGDGAVNPNILDLNYLVNYIFRNGALPPACP